MRLIHCADLHLDSRMTANLTAEKGKERKRELLLTFERMIRYAAEHQVEAILIAGDLFDTKKVSAAARSAVKAAIFGHPEITFFYLRGNHDADIFLPGEEELPENLRMFGSDWASWSLGAEGNIVVSGIELSEENAGRVYLSPVLEPGKFHIVMLHGQAAETGRKDKAEIIRLRELQNRGIDYLALGHVHSYREGALDARGVWCYPGCLEGRGFDECGVHGFVLLEVDEGSGIWSRTFVPFALRTLHEVKADVGGCEKTAELAVQVEAALEKANVPERDLVRVVLTGALDVECEKDLLYLEKRFEPGYYFFRVKDETELRVDIQSYLLDESLKGEFVRTVMADEELSGEEKAGIIRCGLRAIAGEEVTE